MEILCTFYWIYIMVKKYPIGTKIIYKPLDVRFTSAKALEDIGEQGTVVGEASMGNVMIFLPGSTKKKNRQGYTWNTRWENIKPIGQQQLLFNFMYRE